MNKLGFYVENTTVPFLRGALAKVEPPVLLIHAGDRGLLRDIRSTLSPETFVIGRLFVDLPQQAAWLTGGDPEGAGRSLAETIINHDFQLAKERGANGRLLIDAWMSLNEPVKGPASFLDWKPDAETLARYDALDRFQAAFLERMRAEGLEGVAFNFAAGNFVAKDHIVAHFPRSLAAYTYLGFHEYGWPTLMPKPDTATAALLYRTLMDGIRERHGDRHKVIITEAGLARMYRHPNDPAGDVGWLYWGETISEVAYWESLQWYNGHLTEDDYMMGACLYQVGHSGLWETFRHLGQDNDQRPILLIDKIAALRNTSTPTPAPVPTPLSSDPKTGTLLRVAAVKASLQTIIRQADALTGELRSTHAALTTASQAAAPSPTIQEARGLLDRLQRLETTLNSLASGSNVYVEQVRGQITTLRGQATTLLAAVQRLEEVRALIASAQGRLAVLESRTAEAARSKQTAAQLLAQANALETEIGGGMESATIEHELEAATVQDVCEEMDRLAAKAAPNRSLGNIRRIVIHHTGTSADVTPDQIARQQIRRGRPGIACHFLVAGNGLTYRTQGLEAAVNQSRVAAVNADGVAVALAGDFDLAVPAEAQMNAAADLLVELLGDLGLSINAIFGRSEIERGTTSPGMQWQQGVRYRDTLIALVAQRAPAYSRFDRTPNASIMPPS